MTTTHHRDTANGDTYRVRILPDPDASSPRENDNPTILLTQSRDYNSPDKGFDVDDFVPGDFMDYRRIDARRASRYLNLFRPDVLAFTFLRHDSSGLTSYAAGEYADDDTFDGIAVVTRETWEMCMGDSPIEGGAWVGPEGSPDRARTPSAQDVIEGDVQSYNRWANGEYVGAVLEQLVTYHRTTEGDWSAFLSEPAATRTEWSELFSCWGYDDEEWALTDALSWMPATVSEASPSISDDETDEDA